MNPYDLGAQVTQSHTPDTGPGAHLAMDSNGAPLPSETSSEPAQPFQMPQAATEKQPVPITEAGASTLEPLSIPPPAEINTPSVPSTVNNPEHSLNTFEAVQRAENPIAPLPPKPEAKSALPANKTETLPPETPQEHTPLKPIPKIDSANKIFDSRRNDSEIAMSLEGNIMTSRSR